VSVLYRKSQHLGRAAVPYSGFPEPPLGNERGKAKLQRERIAIWLSPIPLLERYLSRQRPQFSNVKERAGVCSFAFRCAHSSAQRFMKSAPLFRIPTPNLQDTACGDRYLEVRVVRSRAGQETAGVERRRRDPETIHRLAQLYKLRLWILDAGF
jgi:hypothetical protein